jgi:F-type H+-transporting ATPase subunit delta
MARVDERQMNLARVYARAILAVAEERGEADALQAELSELGRLLDREPDFADFLASPLVDVEVRRAALERLFRGVVSDVLLDTLQVLNRKRRLGVLGALLYAYRAELRARRGLVDVEVRTAVPLSEGLRGRLAAALVHFTGGKRPDLQETVDPALLGGLVVQVEGQKLDGSLAARLRELGAALAQRATQEILRRRGAPLAGAAEGGAE